MPVERVNPEPVNGSRFEQTRWSVIVAAGGENTALAVKAAAATIPIVFVVGGDPVQLGLVASLNRPAANATGLTTLLGELGAKKLALLRELVPRAATIGFLINPQFAMAESQVTAEANRPNDMPRTRL